MMSFLKSLFSLSLFNILVIAQSEAVELRAVINDSASTRESLILERAVDQGDYAFTDYIYFNEHSNKNLNDEFFRIREYQITRWKQKPVAVIHKSRDAQGENRKILFQHECDTVSQAEQFIPLGFSERCSFFRRGWEYYLGNIHIFVEEIDGLPPSIEVIAHSQEEIFSLFNTIKVVKILTDSVPEWHCKSNED